MKHLTEALPEVLDDERLDRVVAMLGDVPRRVASQLIDDGGVRVDDVVTTKRSSRVHTGQVVAFDVPATVEAPAMTADVTVEFDVLYEDEHLAVVDKPAGLVVHPGAGHAEGTLAHGILARYPEVAGVGEGDRPGIVHRLDRDTSGLLVVARTRVALDGLRAALAERAVTRRYRTVTWGHVLEPRGLIDAPIARSPRDPTKMAVVVGGRDARTSYEVVARYDNPIAATELVCRLETGRTHQIRVHLHGLGHPVVGDPRYGGRRESFPLDRQFLHAEHLAFEHPVSRESIAVDSELPADLRAARERLS